MARANPKYAMFSGQEMERRYARARELMAQRGIDVLLITGEYNFQYFAGTNASIGPHNSLTRPSAFVLPIKNDPIIISQVRDNLVMGSHVADIRDYFDLFEFPHKLVADTLRESGLPNRRVGVELGQEQRMGIPVGAYLALVQAMADTEFVDAADLMITLRMTKSAEELGYIRKAIDVTARARQRLYSDPALTEMTEREAARAIRRLILEEGGDDTSFVHFQYDVQSTFPGAKAPFHYDRPLPKGVVIGIDTGAYVGMYTVDYVRMAILGKPTDAQKRLYAALLEVNRKMAEALRPRVKASEIYRVMSRAAEEAGVASDRTGSRAGHGQGMQLTEPPSVSPKDGTALQPGMVISTEPGIRSGDLGLVWEDTHVITEDGHEQLTRETDVLRELAS